MDWIVGSKWQLSIPNGNCRLKAKILDSRRQFPIPGDSSQFDTTIPFVLNKIFSVVLAEVILTSESQLRCRGQMT